LGTKCRSGKGGMGGVPDSQQNAPGLRYS
jgi:hypothetical protein